MHLNYFSERNLPHFHPLGEIFFITFRLYGTLPKDVVKDLETELISEKINYKRKNTIEKLVNSKFETYLDLAKAGNRFLEIPEVAQIVCDSMHYLNNKEYSLICYCVMPNHVHIVFDHFGYKRQIREIMKSIKGFSGSQSNKLLKRKGDFWYHENYDRVVRNQKELENVISYVIENPVKSGLVTNWEDWKFTYLNKDYK